jgi:hypothetical protein
MTKQKNEVALLDLENFTTTLNYKVKKKRLNLLLNPIQLWLLSITKLTNQLRKAEQP